ncbi:FCS-Like Zinc finger 8-like [Phoenix dactylifera]|uniref:FCS-Like Zinc finger 8-like n=1 Tax=Phoenix dactylifera TaxID=42345 RepID=A0A8B8ZKP9_PHODC|nr:FCS-Like Zinc finger 8-like [Phoenix dactylifera]XP_038974778.1 FCS-Like Zinc finger 8-like [Phoenix dactylifera]XP_038974779.1 FCS-Like Zinc finger 8-like [Phoenix dactylifera]XP_038974780.1 FCS-Like Zinc finger 8-like [Phoenix dactylifera]
MLKKSSRGVGSKQGLVPDTLSLPSPTVNHNKPSASSLFPSPRPSVGFSAKGFSDSEAAMSPTSILETKPFSSSVRNPFFSDRNSRKPPSEAAAANTISESRHRPWDNGGSEPIGLGIVDALSNDKADAKSSKPDSRMVLFGSQLKIQIPSVHPNSISLAGSFETPYSPIEFGIKNEDSQLALLSPARRSLIRFPNMGPEVPASSPRVFTGSISASEMELSEDYTCVISHGPNPKTTHIFDNYIVEESSGDARAASKDNRFTGYHSNDFLSFCYACKKDLGEGEDIFMYRGEKAFCSNECRYQEMLLDERMDKCSPES